ncbi:MAG: hypothetical protein A4S09_16610 [Proteobacteria bacterium SG_bin7]|nr:MAG: hypothetical protein A4S09_16610 [Proteobacteria bacterium SG_bin7]
MKTEKLFNVLVLGGALITTPTIYADVSEQNQRANVLLNHLLEAQPIPARQAFCSADDQATCVEEKGKKVPRAGIVCCWGTSCEG